MAESVLRAGLAAVVAGTLALGPAWASSIEKYHGGDDRERLSANQYVTLEPLIIPMMENGEHAKQLTLIVSVELANESDRDQVRRLTPRLRSEMYEVLFRLVTYRTAKPRVPQEFILRDRLFNVVRRLAGSDRVKSLVIRQAEVTGVR